MARLAGEDFDLALGRLAAVDLGELCRQLLDMPGALRKALAQMLDSAHRKTGGGHPVRLVAERAQATGEFAVKDLPQIRRGAQHLVLLEREPLLALGAPGGVGQHGVGVQLRVEVSAGVVEEQGSHEIAGQPVLLAGGRLAAALAHGGVALHLGEGGFHRLCKRFADAPVAADHGQHAHILGCRKLDVEEGDPVGVVARG